MKRVYSILLGFLFSFSVWSQTITVDPVNELSFLPVTEVVEEDGGFYFNLELNLKSPEFDGKVINGGFEYCLPEGWISDVTPEMGERTKTKNKLNKLVVNFAASCTEQNDGEYYRVVFYSNNKTPLQGNDGVVLSFLAMAPAGTAPGYYPIKIKGFTGTPYFGDGAEAENHQWVMESTSYVKIGQPTAASIKFEKQLPSSVVSALNEETAITTLDLSECTAINGDFKLVDKRGIVLPTEPTEGLEANVSYNRAFANKWGTICLPFDVQNTEAVKYYTLTAISTTDGKMTFTSVEDDEVLPAGTPAIYKSESALNLTAEKLSGAAGKSDDTDGFTPTGTFVNTTGTGLYIANNQFWSGTDFTVPAFRTYFDGDPVKGPSSQSPFRIVVDDEAAGITELEMDEKGNLHEVYNLQGQHIAAPINGQVNIIDGKKAIMK